MATKPKPANMPGQAPAALVEGTTRVLSETFLVYLKTHGFHWNVEGPHFMALHTLFEQQYTEMWMAIDVIAEHLRALGAYAPSSHDQFIANSAVRDTDKVPSAEEMVAELLADHVTLCGSLKDLVKAAESAGDSATADLATARLQVHEKTSWMLRSFLK